MTRWLATFLVILAGLLPLVVRADDATCYAAGQQQCARTMQNLQQGWPYAVQDSCTFVQSDSTLWIAVVKFHYGNSAPGAAGQSTPTFQCGVGENPNRYDAAGAQCQARPSFASSFNGDASDGLCDGGCGFVPDPSAGITITGNAYGQTLAATWKPTGATCDGSGGGATNPMPPVNSPPKFLPRPPNLSQICGGGSCYDPNTNSFCGESGGTQTCIPGSTAHSPGGGCITNGEQTLCAGSPPPSPSPPPASPISDPAKEIKGSDDYTTKTTNGSTTTNQTITVNNYTSGSTPTTSGQQTGDKGPAPASSTGSKGDGTTAFGGGDCSTPPVVNGSGGLNAIAQQTWRTRCAIEGSKLGTGTVNSLGTLYTPTGDTAASVVGDFQAKVQGTPIGTATTGFFSVGAVGGSCPIWVVPESQWLPAMTFDFYCRPEAQDILGMARVVILIACAYVAFQIAMGDS